MGLLDRLECGELGVRWRTGEAQILEQSERSARLVHPAHQVALELVQTPRRLDGRHPTASRAAFERHARQLFEDSFRPQGPTDQPRTRDMSWSPLIEFDEVEVGGRAFWILLRRNYAPGDELVEGQLLVPIALGLLTVSLLARDQVTGYRESTLALLHQLRSTHQNWPQSTQAFFDSPEHDHEFPEHCLSRVRCARRWLLDENAGALVCAEPEGPVSGESGRGDSAHRASGEARPGTRRLTES